MNSSNNQNISFRVGPTFPRGQSLQQQQPGAQDENRNNTHRPVQQKSGQYSVQHEQQLNCVQPFKSEPHLATVLNEISNLLGTRSNQQQVKPTNAFSYFSEKQSTQCIRPSAPLVVQPLIQQVRAAIPATEAVQRQQLAPSMFSIDEEDCCSDEEGMEDEELQVTSCMASYILSLDIFNYLKATESRHKATPGYMAKMQTDINPVMRAILVNWLVEVCLEYSFLTETLYLAVNITDRFLGRVAITRNKLQLVGISALFIAAKYFEMEAQLVDDLVHITDDTYRKDEIIRMESLILSTLSFDVTVITCYDFLGRFTESSNINSIASDMAHFLSELTLQEYGMIGFLPSVIAASCVVVALFATNSPHWTHELKQSLGFDGSQLRPCIASILRMYQDVQISSLNAVKEKFSVDARSQVSQFTCRRQFDYATLI